ncbi:hypothetical protein GOBAR_AA22653 [Gossypium barbadense]|uniref:Uncharacterized protein n=1 Tax=Gossypium barbadense TaxID=3634 RepID=A0A2P5X3V6_GOSBA|nr:hypothetical protein GOBAR_AA22653 [Gossypium barbadense]
MGENWSGANNFEKVEMLISISQVQKLDEIVLLEVGEVRFPVSIREKGWSEVHKIKDSLSKKGKIQGWLLKVKKVIENERAGKKCQKVLVEFNEGNNDAVSVGGLAGDNLGADGNNSGLDRAREDVVNMGLTLVLGPSGGQGGLVDPEVGLGSYSIGGQHLNGGCIPDANKISPNISEVPETEGQVFCQEIEEEFLNAIRSRRKKKHFNKRICSMQDIQDKVLSSKEKLRRDRGKKKDKSKATLGEEKIVNISLSDSDISNRRKVILKKAKQTWELGKKLGLRIIGDKRDVIEDILRL